VSNNMNEFIVWDSVENRELKVNEFAVSKDGNIVLLKEGKIYDVRVSEGRYSLYNYIGKTDVEGNKIYVDSSIVEFVLSGSRKNFKATGYFYFFNGDLSYEFKCLAIDGKKLEVPRTDINWRDAYGKTIKIIDTIQENKLGLIGDKDGN